MFNRFIPLRITILDCMLVYNLFNNSIIDMEFYIYTLFDFEDFFSRDDDIICNR